MKQYIQIQIQSNTYKIYSNKKEKKKKKQKKKGKKSPHHLTPTQHSYYTHSLNHNFLLKHQL